jgi:hypothetical protein
MEYLIGSIATFCMLAYLANKVRKNVPARFKMAEYSQMRSYENIKLFFPAFMYEKPRMAETQLSKYHKSLQMRVIFIDNKAYWIKDNTVYSADLENGQVNQNTTKPIDTMAMDKVELDKMSFIVEMLTEDL